MHGVQFAHERVARIHFVVPVGADQQQILHVGLGEQILDQVQGRSIEPLQIVEKDSQRMFLSREYSDKSPKHELESALGVLWRKVGDWRLFPDDELQFRDEIHNQ